MSRCAICSQDLNTAGQCYTHPTPLFTMAGMPVYVNPAMPPNVVELRSKGFRVYLVVEKEGQDG